MTKPLIIVSEKQAGTMQLVGGEVALRNRSIFFIQKKIDPNKVIAGQLVSGPNIEVVTQLNAATILPATDGLITTDNSLWLSITVADCLPVVIYGEGVIALLHGGWRGLNSRIIESAVSIIRDKLHIDSKLCGYIGPGICARHYEVGEDVAQHFKSYPNAVYSDNEKIFLDLRVVALAKLNSLGISEIDVSKECTFCANQKYFSARRDKIHPTEAMMVLAKLGNA